MNNVLIAQSQNQPIIPSGVVGYWSGNEYSGTKLRDYSGNNNDGTITGCTYVPGNKGSALNFDGLGTNYIDCGTASACNFTTTNFTIMFWIKPTTLNHTSGKDYQPVWLANGGYETGGYYLQDQGNGTGFSLITNQAGSGKHQFVISNNGYLVIGVWKHLTFLRNGAVGTLYCNAVEVTGYVNHDAIVNPASAPNNLTIGHYPGDSSAYWYNGALDDIIMYNRALSVSEITTIYNGTK